MNDLGLDVGYGAEVGGLGAKDKMCHKVAENLEKEKVNVEFMRYGVPL